ncbi:MAG: TolB family protein [Planctomycetota bacterium]
MLLPAHVPSATAANSHECDSLPRTAAAKTALLLAVLAPLSGCGSGGTGGSGAGPLATQATPQLLVGRARVDAPDRFAEIALRDIRNIGSGRIAERAGLETGARLHPDGVRVVLSRERQSNDPNSRELFLSSLDGSIAELRLTVNTERDDDPTWSPDGARVLFASERSGQSGLWITSATGQDPQPFLATQPGFDDDEPDWNATTDRILFRRRDAAGPSRLWLIGGNGFGSVPLTDGGGLSGAGSTEFGDRHPAFDPSGDTALFVRQTAPDRSSLCRVTLATGAVETLLAPEGEVSHPRMPPIGGEIYFGLAEPDLGRQTMRLASIPAAGLSTTGPTGLEPLLLWPDERWQLTSLDFVPWAATTVVLPLTGPTPVDIARNAQFDVALASNAFGSRSQLAEEDGQEYLLQTATSGGREIAGLRCTLELPVEEPLNIVQIRFRAVVRVSRFDGDSLLRLSLRNPIDNRSDTVVELAPDSDEAHELTFVTSSLRHVSRNGTIQVNVIADLDSGDRADVNIDLVACEVVEVNRQL